MPKIKPRFIKIHGTLNGICMYPLNGVYIARKSSAPTKEQIKNDPRFATVKANTQEFGGASILSKAICTGLQHNVQSFKDSYFTSRLSGVCRKIIQKGSGGPGQREAHLLNHKQALLSFQLHKNYIFNQIFTAEPAILIYPERNLITVTIPKSTPNNLKYYPKSATHFTLTAAISLISAHNWHPESQKYHPKHPETNGLGATITTEPLLCKIEHQNIILELKNDYYSQPQGAATTVWLGITFGQKENNQFIPLQTARAMECIGIY